IMPNPDKLREAKDFLRGFVKKSDPMFYTKEDWGNVRFLLTLIERLRDFGGFISEKDLRRKFRYSRLETYVDKDDAWDRQRYFNDPKFHAEVDTKIAYEMAVSMAGHSFKDHKKRVLIVEGGPGTGKSVVAVNLLVGLTNKDMVVHYVSKNSAPRNVFSAKLKGSTTKSHIDNLFKSSGRFHDCDKNVFDVLVVDEAHRLNAKSGMFKNKGENQIKELINASKFSVFFIDEGQRIDIYDIGEKSEIEKYAKVFNAHIEYIQLESQFRCNGSDGYLAWLDDILGIKETANYDGFERQYDFRVIDNPNELKRLIFEKNTKNKARLLAGYCWNWKKENQNKSDVHDIVIGDFSMSWNLGNTLTWAIDKDSINEVGCIHTSQGLEFDHVGVIIGQDIKYENGKIITNHTKRAKTDKSLWGIKKLIKEHPEKAKKIADEIIKNTYRTLMTRGQKSCFVYCCDKGLQEYIKSRIKN
ncbi:MAG: DUF2075 domain-containing protein, partial [Nanoarchaeota archaeon]|nr:DUF2075 domain-containing protein [Nanoarchaeota archaeon]